ncbi:MAG: EamA family transporter [Eubacteriales bacterium]
MWILFAFGSAIFAGITSVIAKMGLKGTDSTIATAVRTVIVLLFTWLMVFIIGSEKTLQSINTTSFIFLMLSGVATGASWLCYFKALQLGDVNKVVPIDKSSTVITMILAFLMLGEHVSVLKIIGMALIGAGTILMISKKKTEVLQTSDKSWIVYALLSALFASLTSILGKIGIQEIESNLGTAIRTIFVLIMAWLVVFIQKKKDLIKTIELKSMIPIILSGVTTGLSWLCYYRALQDGPASVVVPIDKLSLLITVAFSCFILKEKLNAKGITGLTLIVGGTVSLLLQ